MKKKLWIIILSSLCLLLLSTSIYLYIKKPWSKSTKKETPVNSGPVSIPDEILENKFGFLAGHFDGKGTPIESGSGWLRPHPGPFLWDSIQKDENSDYSWKNIDEWVEDTQAENFALLATVWPFADWDQQSHKDSSDCIVPDTDQFLIKKYDLGKKDNNSNYLPYYRCNPYDWDAYTEWITAMVERYDGDGIADMPGLEIPIKYWEVLNEPDINWIAMEHEEEWNDTLDFFMGTPKDYAELLITTYKTIKKADPEAQVLIAGAAGSNDNFLGFYERVFETEGVTEAFDIGNIHCISNDEYWNFNVEPYAKFLEENDIDKPIWVTEAEAMVWSETEKNASQTLLSTENAINAGASKIFYTMQSFEPRFNEAPPAHPDAPELEEILNIDKPAEIFIEIFRRIEE